MGVKGNEAFYSGMKWMASGASLDHVSCKNLTGEVFERETNKLERLRKYNSRNICLSSPEITILRVVRMKVLVPLTVAFGHYHEGEVPDISSYP